MGIGWGKTLRIQCVDALWQMIYLLHSRRIPDNYAYE